MKRRIWALAALSGAVLIVTGWVVYAVVIGLDRADKLSSVVAAILAAVGLVVSFLAWRRPASAGGQAAPAAPVQINQAAGNATVYGVQGGNMIVGDPGPPNDR